MTREPSTDAGGPTLDVVTRMLRAQTISSWVTFSAYSPLNLHHLRQPVPRDAPDRSRGGERYTFEDAFEDLLEVAASGGSLPARPAGGASSSPARSWQRLARAPSYWSRASEYIARLDRPARSLEGSSSNSSLWDAYFPPASFTAAAPAIYRHAHRSSLSQPQVAALVGNAARCPEEEAFRRRTGQGQPVGLGTFFDDLQRSFDRTIEEISSPWLKLVQSLGFGEEVGAGTVANRGQPRGADVEEDLYQPVRSEAFLEPASPYEADRSFGQSYRDGETSSGSSSVSESQTETFTGPEGATMQRTVERWSSDGVTQLTTTTQQYDKAGRLVQRSVTKRQYPTAADSSVAAETERSRGGKDEDEVNPSHGSLESGHNGGHKGWFWTKRN